MASRGTNSDSSTSSSYLPPSNEPVLGRFFGKTKGTLSWQNHVIHVTTGSLEFYKQTNLKKKIPIAAVQDFLLHATNQNELTIQYTKEGSKKKQSMRCQIFERTSFLALVMTRRPSSQSTKVFQAHKARKRNFEQQHKLKIYTQATWFTLENKKNRYFYHNISHIDVFQGETAFCIYFKTGHKKQIFFSTQRDQFIEIVQSNMRDHMGLELNVNQIRKPLEEVIQKPITLSQLPDRLHQIPVRKIKIEQDFVPAGIPIEELKGDNSNHRRLLVLGQDVLSEVDVDTEIVLSQHRYQDIFSLVRLLQDDFCFVVEYTNSVHPYMYECGNSRERDEALSSILEMADRNKHLMDLHLRPMLPGQKIGGKHGHNTEVDELMLKKVASINVKSAQSSWMPVIEEFNDNFRLNKHGNSKGQKAIKNCITLLRIIFDLDKKRKMEMKLPITSSILKTKLYYCSLLRAIARLITLRDIFESMEQYYVDLRVLFILIQFEDELISHYAAVALRFAIDQITVHKSVKKEMSHKSELFNRKVKMIEDIKLRYHQSGRYSLMLSYATEIIELIMHSSLTSTERGLFNNCFGQIDKCYKDILDLIQQTESIKVLFNSCSILRIYLLMLKQTNQEKLREVQEYVLKKTMILRQLQLLVRSCDHNQLTLSAELTGLLVEGYEPSQIVVRTVVPRTIYKSLTVPMKDVKRHLMKKIEKETKPPGGKSLVRLPSPGLNYNWFAMAGFLQKDHSSPSLIWNPVTRDEMKLSLKNEMEDFYKQTQKYHRKDVVWNYEEYEVAHPSLETEPKVGYYYLNNLIGNKDQAGLGKSDKIENPLLFMEQLHHCITFETENEEKRLLALQAITLICVTYKDQIGPYPYIHHIVDFIQPHRNLKLRMVFEIFGFLLQLLKTHDENVVSFIKAKGIQTVMQYVNFVHLPKDEDMETIELFRNREKVALPLTLLISTRSLQLLRVALNHHMTLSDRNDIWVPAPVAKQIICEKEFLPLIVQMLIVDDPYLVESALQIMSELFLYNDILSQDVYKLGFFFFLLLLSDDVLKSKAGLDAVHLMKRLHKNQSNVAKSTERTSIFQGILPNEVIVMLEKLPEVEFLQCFVGNLGTPYMIWNDDMRAHMRTQIRSYISEFFSNYEKDYTHIYEFKEEKEEKEPLEIFYPQIGNAFVNHNIYVENYIHRETWPAEFTVDEPRAFLEELAEFMQARFSALQKEVRTEDDVKMAYVNVKAQTLLFDHSAQPDTIFDNYPGFDSLINGSLAVPGAIVGEEIDMIYHGVKLLSKILQVGSNASLLMESRDLVQFLSQTISTVLTQIDEENLRDLKTRVKSMQDRSDELIKAYQTGPVQNQDDENASSVTNPADLGTVHSPEKSVASPGKESSQESQEQSEEQEKVEEQPSVQPTDQPSEQVVQEQSPESSPSRPVQQKPTVKASDVPALDFDCAHLNDDEKMLQIVEKCLKILLFIQTKNATAVKDSLKKNSSLTYSIKKLLRLPFAKVGETVQIAVLALNLFALDLELREAALSSGCIVYLFKFIMDHKFSGDHHECAKKAVACLRRLAGYGAPQENLQEHAKTIEILETIYPSHFVIIIRTKAPQLLLEEYFEVTESPRILWNEATSNELEVFVTQEINHLLKIEEEQGNAPYDYDRLLQFSYKLHSVELRSASVFVRFFNKIPNTKIDDVNAFFSGLCRLLKDEVEARREFVAAPSGDLYHYHSGRILILIEAMYNSLKFIQNDWDRFHEVFDVLIELITPENLDRKLLYYVFQLLFNALLIHGEPIALVLISKKIIPQLKRLIYPKMVKRAREKSYEMVMHEYIISLVYRLLEHVKDMPSKDLIESGVVLFTLFAMSGCSGHSNVKLRTKASFLCSILLKDIEVEKALSKFAPDILIQATKKNPIESSIYFNRAFNSPELIWNEQTRALFKESIISTIKNFSLEVKSNPDATWKNDKIVPYQVPFKIRGIYMESYIDHPNYPIDDVGKFSLTLAESLAAEEKYSDKQIAQIAESLFITLGQDKYYNEKSVGGLTIDSAKIVNYLSKYQDPSAQLFILKTLEKLSLNPLCCENIAQNNELDTHFYTVLEDQTDYLQGTLSILLRLAVMQPKMMADRLLDQIQLEKSVVSFCIGLLKSQKSQELKDIVSQMFSAVAQVNDELKAKFQNESVYDQYVTDAPQVQKGELFKTPRAPLISGNRYSYLSIEMDKEGENKARAKSLFSNLSEEGLLMLVEDQPYQTFQSKPTTNEAKESNIEPDLTSEISMVSTTTLNTEKVLREIQQDQLTETESTLPSRPKILQQMNPDISAMSEAPSDMSIEIEKEDPEAKDDMERVVISAPPSVQGEIITDEVEILNESFDQDKDEKDEEKKEETIEEKKEEPVVEEKQEPVEEPEKIEEPPVVEEKKEETVEEKPEEKVEEPVVEDKEETAEQKEEDEKPSDTGLQPPSGGLLPPPSGGLQPPSELSGGLLPPPSSGGLQPPSSGGLQPPSGGLQPPNSEGGLLPPPGPLVKKKVKAPVSEEQTESNKKRTKTVKDIAPAPQPGRADLMASIRSGKFKLRSVVHRKAPEPKEIKKPAAQDFHASLLASIKARRQAIDSDGEEDDESSSDDGFDSS